MHKHTWKRSKRKHGRPPRVFVHCTDPQCPEGPGDWQWIPPSGKPFRTNRPRGLKTRVVSYRLKGWQEKVLQEQDLTFVKFVDQAFMASNIVISDVKWETKARRD